MKKFLLSLLGNSFIKQIAIEMSNRIITMFFLWLMGKLHDRFHGRQWFSELQNYLLDIQVEDFFKTKKADIEQECQNCL